jgi:flavin reductase (DIM6/NTAB) family NADH-FMN oxidoreductase RutF
MNLSAANLEQVDSLLKLVDREIWLVTAAHQGQRSGLTATWISQVSLDRERPALLAGLSPRNFTTELILNSGVFAAHLVPHELIPLAYRLAASSGRDGDKLADVALLADATSPQLNVPVIAAARAWFVCRVFQKLAAGDRVFFWADVIAAGENLSASAATSLLKEQAFIQALSLDERKHLKGLREADALALRPVATSWRSVVAASTQIDG